MHFKTIQSLLLLVFVGGFTFLSSVAAASEEKASAPITVPMAVAVPSTAAVPKFKIGFEFQENNRLCLWAADVIEVQKKPIISVFKGARKLWSLEIDTMDFEFVTTPFANTEQALLQESMQTILFACKVLQDVNACKPAGLVVSLDHWFAGLSVSLDASHDASLGASFRESSEKTLGIYNAALRAAPGRADIAEKKSALENACHGLVNQLGRLGYTVEADASMLAVFREPGRELVIPAVAWRSTFQPQVTIQHPLKKTIALLSTLFGPDLTRHKISQALSNPDLEVLKKAPTTVTTSPAEGLIFLHALTCAQLIDDTDLTESQHIAETAENFERYRQVDAKVKLRFLSRRPFSKMWHDIKGAADNFEALYNTTMASNASFSRVRERFPFVNYAEEHYEGGRRADLSELISQIEMGSFDADAQGKIVPLLRQGILSTAMIRQFKGMEGIFPSYFQHTLQSVDHTLARYEFDIASKAFRPIDHHGGDALSPPWFLDLTDSMGAYRDDAAIDHAFGEAIVEIRDIKGVRSNALKQMGVIAEDLGEFLTNKERPLHEHANALFTLLELIFSK